MMPTGALLLADAKGTEANARRASVAVRIHLLEGWRWDGMDTGECNPGECPTGKGATAGMPRSGRQGRYGS